MAFVFLILVFFIDQRGVSDKHCLWPFFHFTSILCCLTPKLFQSKQWIVVKIFTRELKEEEVGVAVNIDYFWFWLTHIAMYFFFSFLRHIHRMWGASGSLWQNIWDYSYVELFNRNDFLFSVAGIVNTANH